VAVYTHTERESCVHQLFESLPFHSSDSSKVIRIPRDLIRMQILGLQRRSKEREKKRETDAVSSRGPPTKTDRRIDRRFPPKKKKGRRRHSWMMVDTCVRCTPPAPSLAQNADWGGCFSSLLFFFFFSSLCLCLERRGFFFVLCCLRSNPDSFLVRCAADSSVIHHFPPHH